jgi:phage-related tail fiber protein
MWDGTNWVRVDPDGIDQTFADARYLQITTAASTYLALAGGTMTGNLTLVGNPSTTNMAANKGYVDTQVASITPQDMTPAGTIIWSARNTAPTGYLKANGAAISRTTYATLFSAIGTTFGSGDGSTTFNVPDLRGEFARGWDDGRGIDTGRTFGSAQASANLAHTHGITDPGHLHTWNFYQGGWNSGTSGNTCVANNLGTVDRNTSTASTGITINNSGDTEARPRNIALLACIKT